MNTNEPPNEKTNNLGFDQVRQKPGCTVTDDGERLESENKGDDQLHGHREADLRLCFRPSIMLFSYAVAQIIASDPISICKPEVAGSIPGFSSLSDEIKYRVPVSI